MAMFRVNKTHDYTVLSNYHIRDKRLSLKAKGLLTLMLSLPDDWDYSISGFVAICKESKTSIQSAIKELEESGYVVKIRGQDEKGRFFYEYNVFEKPRTENPHTENPCTENPPQLNTNIPNTNIPNTDKTYTEHRFEEFWSIYPRNKEKARAHKCYTARLNDGYSEEELITACKEYAAECKKNKTEEKYIKHAATFLGANTPFTDYLRSTKNDTGREAAEPETFSDELRRMAESDNRPFEGW